MEFCIAISLNWEVFHTFTHIFCFFEWEFYKYHVFVGCSMGKWLEVKKNGWISFIFSSTLLFHSLFTPICNPVLLLVMFCFFRRLFSSTISPFDCFYDVLSSFIAHSVNKSAKFPFTSFHCNFFDIFNFMFCIFHVH